MIELENISKTYPTHTGQLTVLKALSLYVARGEFVSVMGPSGSGKSTLAAILGCLALPSAGRYLLDGKAVSDMSEDELARFRNERIGYIFQDFNLLEGMSAVENVELPLVYAGVGAGARRKRAIECLEKVNLADRIDHLPKQLSGGQKQRVAIARALVGNPALIFADEPTGALDAKNTVDVMDLLQRLNVAGHTIIQVTHSPEDAQFSKRIVHLVDGQLVKDELVENFSTSVRDSFRGDGQGIVSYLWEVAAKVGSVDPQDLRALRRLYRRTEDIRGLIEAAKTFARYENNEFVAMLHKIAQHPHWAVRAEVIKACSVSSHDHALAFFVAGLRDENAWVRFLALGRLTGVEMDLQQLGGHDRIIACLDDPDERVRAAAVNLVGRWPDARFHDKLLDLAARDRNQRVRSNAIEAVARRCAADGTVDAAAIEVFRQATGDTGHRVASTAAVCLFAADPEAARACLSRLRAAPGLMERAAAAWALGVIGPPQASGGLLLEMLRAEPEEIVRRNIVRGLASQAKLGYSLSEQIAAVISDTVAGQSDAEADTPKPPVS